MRQRIYVAGPISIGDRQKNVQQALEAGQKLVEMGYAPLVPHLSCFWEDRGYSIPHEKWLEIDLPWVEVCDALLRLPGESKGADAEVQRAKDVGITVYYSLEELQAYPPEDEKPEPKVLIPGLAPNVPVVTNKEGGRQSSVEFRCDLLPPLGVLAVAQVLLLGAMKHAPNNWRKISIKDHLNHALIHLLGHLAGDVQDDHLSHATCRMLFALELAEIEKYRQCSPTA